ncbi:MAG: hypothetical protein ABIH66_07915 [bacterium]
MRRKSLLVLLSVVLALAAGCSKKETGPRTYTAPDGSFSVVLPGMVGDMEMEEKEIDSPMGKKMLSVHSAEGKNIVFTIKVLERGVPDNDEAAVREIQAGGMKAIMGDGEITKKGEIEIDGRNAFHARFKKEINGKTGYVEAVEIYAGGMQHQFQVLTYDESKLDDPAVMEYFKSFKYLEEETGEGEE